MKNEALQSAWSQLQDAVGGLAGVQDAVWQNLEEKHEDVSENLFPLRIAMKELIGLTYDRLEKFEKLLDGLGGNEKGDQVSGPA